MACCESGASILTTCAGVGTGGTEPSGIAGCGGVADMAARSSWGHVAWRCLTKSDLSDKSRGSQPSWCWLSRLGTLRGDLGDAALCLGGLLGTTGIGTGSKLVGQAKDIVELAGHINLYACV